MDNPFDPDPRIMGVREHQDRANWFCRLADRTVEPVDRHRLLFAAMYSARAIVEVVLDAAESQVMRTFHDKDHKASRRACEAQLAPQLPHYHLVEKIRIHDFHRFGCLPPRPNRREMFFAGPLKLTANQGAAVLAIPPTGPQVTLTGNSTCQDQRSLCNSDGAFYDAVSKSYLPGRQILTEYLRAVPSLIAWFENEVNSKIEESEKRT